MAGRFVAGGEGGKVFAEEWTGQLSLRKVVCSCGMSPWCSSKPRGLSRAKHGQQGSGARERMESGSRLSICHRRRLGQPQGGWQGRPGRGIWGAAGGVK